MDRVRRWRKRRGGSWAGATTQGSNGAAGWGVRCNVLEGLRVLRSVQVSAAGAWRAVGAIVGWGSVVSVVVPVVVVQGAWLSCVRSRDGLLSCPVISPRALVGVAVAAETRCAVPGPPCHLRLGREAGVWRSEPPPRPTSWRDNSFKECVHDHPESRRLDRLAQLPLPSC